MDESPEEYDTSNTIAPILLSTWHRLLHQISHPITSIRFAADGIRRSTSRGNPDSIERRLKDITKYCDHLDLIVENASILAAPSDYSHIQRKRHDIRDLLNTIREQIEHVTYFERRNIQFEIDDSLAHTPFPRVNINLHYFKQIIYAIISNAAKYSDRNTKVKIILAQGYDQLQFIAQNQCSSATQEIAENCFKEGWRGQQMRDFSDGLGIGLSIANRLAQVNGWNLKLQVDPPIVNTVLQLPLNRSDD